VFFQHFTKGFNKEGAIKGKKELRG